MVAALLLVARRLCAVAMDISFIDIQHLDTDTDTDIRHLDTDTDIQHLDTSARYITILISVVFIGSVATFSCFLFIIIIIIVKIYRRDAFHLYAEQIQSPPLPVFERPRSDRYQGASIPDFDYTSANASEEIEFRRC